MTIHVALMCGGESAEHEISVASAKFILESLDQTRFSCTLIRIDKEGFWHLVDTSFALTEKGVSPFEGAFRYLSNVDVVFPAFHGPLGEDGSFQGLFQVFDIPYVGAAVLGSSVAMDKDVMKRLLRDANMKIPKFISYTKPPTFEEVVTAVGLPFFVKPANMGSSIGMTKVETLERFQEAIAVAFLYDTKIIIEEAMMEAREIECSVLGLDVPIASLPGEVIPKGGVYTYEAKYIESEGTEFHLPVRNLSPAKIAEVRALALQVFSVLSCEGMARVDFFLTKSGEFYVNELNTLPGFTPMSVYPKLWEVSGIPSKELVSHLIEVALIRYNKRKGLSLEFQSPLSIDSIAPLAV